MAGAIKITNHGSFSRTINFLGNKNKRKLNIRMILNRYGRLGVDALTRYTPKDTGKTAFSWKYKIEEDSDEYKIIWYNDNTVTNAWVNGKGEKKTSNIPIVILIQFGHGTRNGGYVKPNNFIEPALKPILDNLANIVGEGVLNA